MAVLTVLLTVMIALSTGELLSDVAGGRIPAGLIGLMVLLRMPEVLSNIIPLAIFVAITWGLGRFYRDQEMAVMRASGFGWAMLLRPLFNLLLPISAFALVSAIFLAPFAANYQQFKLEEAFRSASEWGLQTGQFHVLSGGDTVLYVESVDEDGKTLSNIFMQQRSDDREQIWIADEGFYWLDEATGIRYLTLENGQITEGARRSLDFNVMKFSRNDLRLPQTESESELDEIATRASRDLLFSGEREDIAEIQFRVSPAIAVIILGLLALPLAHTAPREGRGGRIVIGMLGYVIYANVLYLSRVWIANGILPPALGLWWVHLVVLAIAVVWLNRQGRMGGRARS